MSKFIVPTLLQSHFLGRSGCSIRPRTSVRLLRFHGHRIRKESSIHQGNTRTVWKNHAKTNKKRACDPHTSCFYREIRLRAAACIPKSDLQVEQMNKHTYPVRAFLSCAKRVNALWEREVRVLINDALYPIPQFPLRSPAWKQKTHNHRQHTGTFARKAASRLRQILFAHAHQPEVDAARVARAHRQS